MAGVLVPFPAGQLAPVLPSGFSGYLTLPATDIAGRGPARPANNRPARMKILARYAGPFRYHLGWRRDMM